MTGPTHTRLTHLPPGDERSVHFSERDISDARRLLAVIVGCSSDAPEGGSSAGVASPAASDPERLKKFARQMYKRRQKRIERFGSQMFGEPAWEMLLILYLEEGGERQSQTRLADLSGAARSTAMRWIDHLVRKGLANREDHPTDKRRNFIALSDKGRQLLELYLSETCG
ncbi:MAG TPA: MarR family transcriptional regulator [Sphingomicrobium sp.]|nr:MarR family transcriptional regulator [Sphingomicrobium sp.]